MFPDPDNKLLLRAVFKQLDGKIVWKEVAADIGAENVKAAQNRWGNYKRKLFSECPSSSTTTKTKSLAKPGTMKKTGKISASKSSTPKKRKLTAKSNDNDDDEGDDSDLSIKDDENVTEAQVAATPTRKLPSRRARVTSFKEEKSDRDKDLDGKEDFDDSGHGGTETDVSGRGDTFDDQV